MAITFCLFICFSFFLATLQGLWDLSSPTQDGTRAPGSESTESFFFLNLFIYLFLSALGLCCCARAFSNCGERGLLFIVVHGLLIVAASLVAEHGL